MPLPPAKEHAQWLSLVDVSGPFLSIAALTEVFPHGLDGLEPARAAELRAAYEEWADEAPRDLRFHRAWVRYVIETLLEWDRDFIAEGQAIPDIYAYTAVEHGGETIRPDYVLHPRGEPNHARALVCIYPTGTPLEKPLPRALWTASPAARTLSLLRAAGVRIGIVTNGEHWMLINAPAHGLAGYVSWYAELWHEERELVRAFYSLLTMRRFFGVADEDTLEAMLERSANDTQEVTDQLGIQVRHAIEILVRSFDRANQDMGGVLLAQVSMPDLYQAALRVMMRLVFLLSAEERGLFLLGDPLYDQSYAVSTLGAQLRADADRVGEDVLERRSDAWARLLATFRLVFGGAAHHQLSLPAYGGSLFDPDGFAFLEGRVPGGDGRLPEVDNRTVLHLLEALQELRIGGEKRRLSFRALDVEQIGHVYEGLLDHEASRADEVTLGLNGGDEPEIRLAALTAQKSEADLIKFIKEATGRTPNAIRRALTSKRDPNRESRLKAACHQDDAIFNAALPFLNLLRDDEFDYPIVILPGSVFVTAGTERRATGTHYTPKSLTEPIVQHTLEPLVYHGAADGVPPTQETLKSPREILALKVCDMAMGSGAFLVQSCRYLAARLTEAWEYALAAENTPIPRLTIDGDHPSGALGDVLIPDDAQERMTLAQRLIADRCLYGVDKNRLAVEMAKLSLWLTTLAKGRPFTFLDHALKCGDSLLGVSFDQLRMWNLDPSKEDVPLYRIRLAEVTEEIIALRQQIESFPVTTVADQRRKQQLFNEAQAKSADLRSAADTLILSYMVKDLSEARRRDLRLRLLDSAMRGDNVTEEDQELLKDVSVRYTPFHWELEFPEVFMNGRGGFDAFVGNPPFMGGKKISGAMGENYREYLVNHVGYGVRGESIDLCAYFFTRAYQSLRDGGAFGLIATNTIAQGDTREVGLVQLDQRGGTIYRAVNDYVWEGAAAVVVDIVHVRKGSWDGQRCLDGQPVAFITPLLDDIAVDGRYLPYKLTANADKSFIGSYVLGMGFVLEPDEAQALIDQDPRNRDVLFPYLNGEDLNDQPDQAPTRWVINFFDWSEEMAQAYPDVHRIVVERVKPERDKLANGNTSARDYARRWWQYGRMGIALYRTIAPLRRVIALALTSKHLNFAFVDPTWVYSHACGVIAFENASSFATLHSTPHDIWTRKFASTLETRLRYTPSDCFETFPFPPAEALPPLDPIGEQYHETRRRIMLNRQEGLTATYNRFHNPDETSADIQELRDLHRTMDQAVAFAYGWDDLNLAHDFYDTNQGKRYTISEDARREVLRRLLALNFERYEAEQRLGVIGGKKKGRSPHPQPLSHASGERGDSAEDDPNAPPPDQTSFLDDDTPKQPRLF